VIIPWSVLGLIAPSYLLTQYATKTLFDIDELIIAVFSVVDKYLTPLLQCSPPRRKGAAPALSDSEVLPLEIVGGFLGHHGEARIWRYFRHHWHAWFPHLPDWTLLNGPMIL
jgi:hypothetical protein